MTNVIQMVWITEDNCLFIKDYNDKGELTFRTTKNPAHLQTEKVVIEGELVYTNLYHFHVFWLKKFLSEAERN